MDILYTPWRRQYVISARETEGCVFCHILKSEEDDRKRHILHRGKKGFLLLNLFPYTPGHLMAIPYRHIASTTELEADEFAELTALCGLSESLLRESYGCRSVHIGANLGEAAGAGVPGHLHFHIVAWPEQPLLSACTSQSEPPEAVTETYERLLEKLPAKLNEMGEMV